MLSLPPIADKWVTGSAHSVPALTTALMPMTGVFLTGGDLTGDEINPGEHPSTLRTHMRH